MKNILKHSHNYLSNKISVPFPNLPETLNLMINDICNSRCKMCNVWKQKPQKELTPEELEKILKDPLFKKINYIGVSGGEPTLKKDLPKVFRVIAKKRGVKGTGIITNAIQADRVIQQIERCYKICDENTVIFNVMISLDGIGYMNDLVRGSRGNFSSACKVIRYIRDHTDIPLTIACTVIKENVWHLDEVLDFCREENVYGRFRIAEFINRLYNDHLKESIRNFDDDEKYQIALFFSKLEIEYEKNPNVQETYKNIRQMIFEDKPRQCGCPYQSNAVGLDSRGNLLFCSPKSPILGSCLEKSAKKIYQNNMKIRASIIKNDCKNCIHDYHAPPGNKSLDEKREEKCYQIKFSVKQALKKSSHIPSAKLLSLDWSRFMKPLIIGWYGTETAGDKAILGHIIQMLKRANPKSQISMTSIYPFITQRTLYELSVEGVKIIKTYSSEFLRACQGADVILMGGGPLMHIEPLGFVLQAFSSARKINIPTSLEGCGIGPLTNASYKSAVIEILRLSNQINVRDNASLDWLRQNTNRVEAKCSGDPSVAFVKDWVQTNQSFQRPTDYEYFACFLREITQEYALGMGPDEFDRFRNKFEVALGKMIISIIKKTGLKPFFIPMHTFVIGKDDRDFARRFASTYLQGFNYRIGNKIYSPPDILSIMQTAPLNICMRYHSVVFAETLNVPFIAIDYTGGGKVKCFLRGRQKEDLMIDRMHLAQNNWEQVMNGLLKKLSPIRLS